MMTEFLNAPLAQAIAWALLHLIWQGAIVAAILAATLALLKNRSANLRYAAACAALALLPLLAVATAWRCYEPTIVADTPIAFHADSLPVDLAKAAVAHATKEAMVSAGDLARAALPDVLLLWLAGVTILSIRLFVGLARVQRMVAQTAPASMRWESSLRRLRHALGLRSAVALLESAAVEIPTVVGWLRPAVLLPASTLSGLSPDQIEMLLAHELAHIRRNDFFVNVLQSIVETLMFYHPAVWWISGRIRAEREHCCDDLAVQVCGNAVQYARALTRLEEVRSARAGLAVAANGGSLVGRIRRLAGMPVDATATASRWLAGLGVLAVVALVLSVPTLPADAQHPAAPKGPPATIRATPPAAPQVPSHTSIEVTPAGHPDDDDVDLIVPEPQIDDAAIDAMATSAAEAAVAAAMPVPQVMPVPRAPAAPPASPALAAPAPPPAPMPPLSPAIAEGIRRGIAGGVRGGIAGGVRGGIAGGIRGGIRSRHEFGASGKLTVDELIELRNAGVTPAYIEEMKSAGFGTLSLGDLAMLGLHGVRADYIKELRAAGLTVGSAEDAAKLRTMGVTPAYVREMRQAGYSSLGTDDFVRLRAMNVTPKFIKALSDAGYTNLSADDLIRLAARGITPEFIREISQYRNRK